MKLGSLRKRRVQNRSLNTITLSTAGSNSSVVKTRPCAGATPISGKKSAVAASVIRRSAGGHGAVRVRPGEEEAAPPAEPVFWAAWPGGRLVARVRGEYGSDRSRPPTLQKRYFGRAGRRNLLLKKASFESVVTCAINELIFRIADTAVSQTETYSAH